MTRRTAITTGSRPCTPGACARQKGSTLHRTTTSLIAWAAYDFVVGATLLLAPNLLLGILRIPSTDEVWIRVAGVLAFVIGAFFLQSARTGNIHFYRLTVHVRIGAGLLFAALVVAGAGPPVLLLFVVIEWLGAAWTGLALRAETAAAT